ncbi:magnesium-translocating P-type ATPase [Sulfurospirillum diekertiae]|uniref:Magnesium-transporting ATPase, P-type 1 n=1 Tax=Sulfurospirillum diekertiae TaxID=1854492 RepID=A0A6G9VTK2_9BACT|nr:magnesium-translocating P-type ATPase [Sulfurospirillum diekertiae]QIR75697.1 magnesium-translocating P-type ATPase [Sulfurospirillum diekertiae]QIR78344.1 magnesium-translocating P-type ATPase [Sulfurospirillum diekertiae]
MFKYDYFFHTLVPAFLPKNFKASKQNIASTQSSTHKLKELATCSKEELFEKLGSSEKGLSKHEAHKHLLKFGANIILENKKANPLLVIFENIKNPLTLMLIVLASVSLYMDDVRTAVVVGGMTLLSVALSSMQEFRSSKAAEKLSSMVSSTATVLRQNDEPSSDEITTQSNHKIHESHSQTIEIAIKKIVPGDIVHLSAGDIIPADLRIISSKDLFLNQASLTGEAMPVEKVAINEPHEIESMISAHNICFMGSSIESGTAIGVVCTTGKETYLGSIAKVIESAAEPTSFDIGIKKFTWLMLRFMFIMVPVVMLVNGFLKHDWMGAFLFGLSVAVGLAPEMLPMIVTVNLSKGAFALSKQKVIVKKLSAIQNFGAMDILCTDKTGTLTQDKIILEQHVNVNGEKCNHVLELAYLNSFHQTGLKNLLDVAVLEHSEIEGLAVNEFPNKVDEIPFDFNRKRMSVVVGKTDNSHLLITKGAVEEMVKVCTHVEKNGEILPLDTTMYSDIFNLVNEYNNDGFRVIAVAYKNIPNSQQAYAIQDESQMILAGFMSFLDPPKESAKKAIKMLNEYGVSVKVLTGDNERVTTKICKDVGLEITAIYQGADIDAMNEEELKLAVEKANVFAKLSPDNKARIVSALRQNGHTVGFMGDGINDAPALKLADVGISVDTAVDIAKETADIILLERSLLVLEQGVLLGRKVFANIIKYIKMGSSSNYGNMFSVVGASALLPFIPMHPIQIVTNNFLYDLSQSTTPTDHVDDELIKKPKKWDIADIKNFMLIVGPTSSVFDYITFGVMIYIFDAWHNEALFQTGWFVESLISQTLIVHIIRTDKIPFFQSTASLPVILMTASIMCLGIWLPFSPFAASLGLVALPTEYWSILGVMMIGYIFLTQSVKMYYIKKFARI